MNGNVEEKLFAIIEKIIHYDEDIIYESNLIENLGFTSIDLMELIYKVESEFDIHFCFEDLDLEKIVIVGNLIQLIANKIDGEK